tara:strand:- start:344 stop:1057 length:714 start_codon:yes stop_codon:yes gene_type:complete
MTKFWCVDALRIASVYYVVAVIIAILLYPGGNHIELDQVGYSLHKNFLSELGFHKTMSGDLNFFSSFFWNTAMYMLLLQGIAFLFIPSLFRENRFSFAFACLGTLFMFPACIFFVGVALTPGDIFFDAHIFTTTTAFNLYTVSIFFYVLAFISSSLSNYYTSGAILLLIAVSVYSYYLSGYQPIDAIKDRELYLEVYTMDLLIFNVVLQKVIISLMIITIITFSFGLNKLINKKETR